MKLVWHAEDLWEQDWLRFLLGEVVTGEVTDLGMTYLDHDTIHVVGSEITPLKDCETYFRRMAPYRNRTLVHVSDELFSGGYRTYAHFDHVIRWNHSYLLQADGVLTVPLGYPNGTAAYHGIDSQIPADQRPYLWSFVGEVKASRRAMLAAFNGLEPCRMIPTDSQFNPTGKKITKHEFNLILAQSVFSPCPMGNTTLDTSRVYEALEFGAVPIVELRPTLDYYRNLFGPHPIPTFASWHKARAFVEGIYADEVRLLALQTEVQNWWRGYKRRIAHEVQAAVSGPSQAADLQRFAARLRNRHPIVHEPYRLAELLRHQTAGSLLRRISNPAAPLKRLVREAVGR